MLIQASRLALNIGLGLAIVATMFGLQAPRAEMIRPGEEIFEELTPLTASPSPLETPGPRSAPYAFSREGALARARLTGSASPQAKQYSVARLAALAPEDPLLEDLRLWRALQRGEALGPQTLRAFLNRRAAWPRLSKSRRAAERKLSQNAATAEIRAFFADAAPTTAYGARRLGEALIDLGRKAEGEAWILAGWRDRPATNAEETRYLKRWRSLIEPHLEARFNRLVWRRELTQARRLAKEMPEGWDALAEALIALYGSHKGVDGKIKRVPDALRRHPTLAHARTLWRERKRRRAEAEAELREATRLGRLGDPAAWADLRMRFARDAYEDGRHADAAALADGHGLASGGDFADLEWFAGWIRLRQLDQPMQALLHFERLWGGVKTPISRSRAAYWAGEAAAAAGETETAQFWRERAHGLASAYYGQLGAERLGDAPDLADHAAAAAPFDPTAGFSDADRGLAEAADALYGAGFWTEGRLFLKTLAARRRDAPSLAWIAGRARAWGDAYAEIEIGKAAFLADAPLWSSLYPTPPSPRFFGRRVEPALLLAVARQESRFRRTARSGAGAVGLMQMMPATAKAAARRLKLPYQRERLNADPSYNLSLADAHLAGVIERYDGSYLLSVAAYNAGEGNVDKWIKRFGDPRDPSVDPIDWIESIPFYETRNYVQRVLEGAQVYRVLLGSAPQIALTRDLRRGGRPAVAQNEG